MSLIQSIRYVCIRCKQPFRYNNNCRCKMCNVKIDADVCLSCHNLKHINTIYYVMSCFLAFISYMGVLHG